MKIKISNLKKMENNIKETMAKSPLMTKKKTIKKRKVRIKLFRWDRSMRRASKHKN
jgi:hypothetical protein